MSIISLTDRGGQTMKVLEVNNVRMSPAFPKDVLPEIPKLKLRDDDILIAAWMRSGTHWIWEIISMLMNNNTETIPKKKEEHMLEFQPIRMLDVIPSPRILNTHLHFRYLPEDLKTKRCRVIYLMRDPRDVIVSWFRVQKSHIPYEYTGEWHNWLPLQLEGELEFGTWFDHVRNWENAFDTHHNLDVHFLFYEELKKNQMDELRKLNIFLGTNASEDLLKNIIEKCDLDRMRADKHKYEWLEDGVCIHYMKGEVGAWKELFTVAQYEEFEKLYRENMSGSKFEDRYKGPVEIL